MSMSLGLGFGLTDFSIKSVGVSVPYISAPTNMTVVEPVTNPPSFVLNYQYDELSGSVLVGDVPQLQFDSTGTIYDGDAIAVIGDPLAFTGVPELTTGTHNARIRFVRAEGSEDEVIGEWSTSSPNFNVIASTIIPSQFSPSDWSVADLNVIDGARITITTLPSDGGSSITDIQYQVDGSSWATLGGTTTGEYDISGLTYNTAQSIAIRIVNAIGNGTASATKNVTPTGIAEAETVFAAFTTPPTTARAILINDCITSMITTGVWSKLDFLHIYAAADSQASLINWKAPGTFNATVPFGIAFTADRGCDTTGGLYINTGFNPVTAAGQFTQNSAHLGVWSLTSAQTTGIDIGARISSSSKQNLIQTRNTTDQMFARLNVDASPSVSGFVTDAKGHFTVRRSASNAWSLFKNATLLNSGVDASVAPASLNFYVGGVNLNGSFASAATKLYAADHAGASLNNTEMTNLYNALLTYLQAVGAM